MYAVWWIRQSILQAIYEQAQMVRLPYNKIDGLKKICRESGDYFAKHGQEAPPENILAEMNKHYKVAYKLCGSSQKIIFYDQQGDDEDSLGIDRYGKDEGNIENGMVSNDLKKIINDLLDRLSTRESDIIQMRYGLNGYEHPLSRHEIKKKYNLKSEERVRQIEEKAIFKLKDMTKGTILVEYFSNF